VTDDFIVLGCSTGSDGTVLPVVPADAGFISEADSGRPAAALTEPANWNRLVTTCAQAVERRIPVRFVAEYQAAGRPRVLDAKVIPLFDDEDHTICRYFVCSASDVAADYYRMVAGHESMPGVAGELAAGLNQDQFELAYQPIFEMRSGRLTGVEALIRWNHPSRGALDAAEFIRAAERSGLINELGEWVLWTACHKASEWNRMSDQRIGLSVNISAAELHSGQAQRSVVAALAASGLDPGLLTLDIAASTLLADRGDLPALLGHFGALGINVTVDDFGLAYRAILSISQLVGQTIKVDRSLVRDVDQRPEAHQLLADLMRAHESLDVVYAAEGVETEEELRALRALGFDSVQGRYRCPPLLVEEANELLTSLAELPLH